MENNKKITKQLVVSNIADSVKILKNIISKNGYGTKSYIANNQAKTIRDIIYSLRDLRYSLQGYNACVSRSKQHKAYSIDEILAELKNLCDNSSNKTFNHTIHLVIELLKPICEYRNNSIVISHSTLISQRAVSGDLTEMQKSLLLINLSDLNKAKTFFRNVILGNGRIVGIKPLGLYYDNNYKPGMAGIDLLNIINIKNKIKSIIASIDDVINTVNSVQRDILKSEHAQINTELSEDDELY